MKKITVGSELPKDTEHLVLEVTTEPVLIHFLRQVDDILITSPEGDILVSWDLNHDSEWSDTNCLLLKTVDNMKEIGGIKTSLIAVKAVRDEKIKIYLTAQIN